MNRAPLGKLLALLGMVALPLSAQPVQPVQPVQPAQPAQPAAKAPTTIHLNLGTDVVTRELQRLEQTMSMQNDAMWKLKNDNATLSKLRDSYMQKYMLALTELAEVKKGNNSSQEVALHQALAKGEQERQELQKALAAQKAASAALLAGIQERNKSLLAAFARLQLKLEQLQAPQP